MVINRKPGDWLPLLFLIMLLPGLACFFTPLVLSTDSLYGFLAYKGSVQTGSFNVIADVSTHDINQLREEFISWWSPGQWLAPGLLHYTTGIEQGVASVIITMVFAAAGLLGYYNVFTRFDFTPRISILSLVILFFSSNFNYSYIVYQGGEILSFGIFPWFLLYALSIRKISALHLALLTFFFLACFVAKTTMTIYCSLVLLYKWTEPVFAGWIEKRRFRMPPVRYFLYGLPLLISAVVIYYFFLSKGSIPTVVNQLGISTADILIPLSSPVTGILSVQNVMAGIMRPWVVAGGNRDLLNFLYIIPVLLTFWLFKHMFRNRLIDPAYKRLVALLYTGVCAFFIFSYLMNTNIDYSTRHLKLMAFLCVPGFITVITGKLRPQYFYALLVLAGIFNIYYFVQLRQKLTAGRYVSVQHFYRNNDKPEETDSLDKESYQKILDLSKKLAGEQRQVIFYIEANPDVSIDLPQPCIMRKPGLKVPGKVFNGRGPLVIACMSIRTLHRFPDLLEQTFPDCGRFACFTITRGGYAFFVPDGMGFQ